MRLKYSRTTAVLLLGVGFAVILLILLLSDRAAQFSGTLPVGSRTPRITLGERHGIILAGDGTLWSWGCDFLGWPVLGLPGTNRTVALRQIGKDKDWANVWAGDCRNVALKTDGTLWFWGESAE